MSIGLILTVTLSGVMYVLSQTWLTEKKTKIMFKKKITHSSGHEMKYVFHTYCKWILMSRITAFPISDALSSEGQNVPFYLCLSFNSQTFSEVNSLYLSTGKAPNIELKASGNLKTNPSFIRL